MQLNKAVAHIQSMEKWLKNREKKVVQLEAAASNLGNMKKNIDESSFTEGNGLDFSGFAGWEHSSESAETDEGELERLSDELDEDFSSLNMSISGIEGSSDSRMPMGGADPMLWAKIMAGVMQHEKARQSHRRRRQQSRRSRSSRGASQLFDNEKSLYAAAATAMAAAAAMQQQQQMRSYYPSRNNWFHKRPQHYVDENIDFNMEREWAARGRPPSDRINTLREPTGKI